MKHDKCDKCEYCYKNNKILIFCEYCGIIEYEARKRCPIWIHNDLLTKHKTNNS